MLLLKPLPNKKALTCKPCTTVQGIFGYFWVFLGIFGYFWVFLGILGDTKRICIIQPVT